MLNRAIRVVTWFGGQIVRLVQRTVQAIRGYVSTEPSVGIEPRLHAQQAEGRAILWVGLLAQLFGIKYGINGWFQVGGSMSPLVVGVTVFCTCCAVYDWLVWRMFRRSPPRSEDSEVGAFGCAFLLFGWLSATVLVGFLILSIGASLSLVLPLLLEVLLFVTLSAVVCFIIRLTLWPLPDRPVSLWWWWLGIGGMVTAPMLVAWVAASSTMRFSRDEALTVKAWLDAHTSAAVRCEPWTIDSKAMPVAVTLSGGGYRAALIHSGVLAALDEQCVPIDLLSTVSGGSIVGAAYSLGMPPREFAAALVRQRPGLPDARLSIVNALKGSSDLHRDRLAQTFFGQRTIQELPDRPVLLINTTELYAAPERARLAIKKGWPVRLGVGDPPRIADAVAASSAFPGPFAPISVKAVVREEGGISYSDHLLVDGGVVENLGTEGLRTYLADMTPFDWYRRKPALLIVSDATGYSGSARMLINPALDEMLLRANAIQYDTLHRLLLRELTGVDALAEQIEKREAWQQYYSVPYPHFFVPRLWRDPVVRERLMTSRDFRDIEPELTTVVISTTASATGLLLAKYPQCIGPSGEGAAELQRRVSAIATLDELGPRAAQDAFWIGYTLGQVYGPAIECARRKVAGRPCEGDPRVAGLKCPREIRGLLRLGADEVTR